MEQIAIHEAQGVEAVVEFKNLSEFTKEFQNLQNEGDVYGVFYNKNNEIVAELIGGELIKDIIV